MASSPEVILPIGTQKHDPAWKHCQMVRSGGRTYLKCMYCTKLFLGGGIHRIKEHLAKQKGNASRCAKVPPEVQNAMQDSLDTATMRRKKKLKLAEVLNKYGPGNLVTDGNGSQPGLQMVALPHVVDSGPVDVVVKEEGTLRNAERGRKRREKAEPQLLLLPPPASAASDVSLPAIDKDPVYMAIGRFLFEAGVYLDAVDSVYFQPMVDAIASAGPGLQVPSYHDFRGSILKRSIDEVNATLENFRGTWSQAGCSVLADEWVTDTGKTLINFLVYCPEGMMFLRSDDASQIITSEEALFELLKLAVEQVGDRNVVQVITKDTEVHVLAGRRLTEAFPTLFWTPCASRCIDAMLDDFVKCDEISRVIEEAKSITRLIYSHADVLNMMRKQTNGRDLLVPTGEISAAMNFIALKNMSTLAEELRAMFTSEQWEACPRSAKDSVIGMANFVHSTDFWARCAAVVRITEPLVGVLKIVDSYRRPAMGYIYVAMHQAKEVIKKEPVMKETCTRCLKIIDQRWNGQLPRPLYAAGFFLNPMFYYNVQGEISNEILSGMLDCIERLVPEPKIQDKIQKELNLYKSAAGDFGRQIAVRTRNALRPAEWWSEYGRGCPNLTRLAIRILSQTCSARGCERSRIPFEEIHNQRLNYLEHQRLCELVFVRYNLRLQQRHHLKNRSYDPISVDNIDIVNGWVKSELFSETDEVSCWMELNQPVAFGSQFQYPKDEDAETFISRLDVEMIQGAVQEAEDNDDDRIEEDNTHDSISLT